MNMFQKLRNHFILTTMSLLSAVLVVSFVAIYLSTAARLSFNPPENRPIPTGLQVTHLGADDFREYIDEQRRTDADRTLRELAATLTLIGLATLAAGYFISRYLADRAIRPVRDAYDKQQQFIADASHELKTPLAVIDANIEAELIDKKRPSKWLRNIQSETIRMSELVTGLLTLARLDSTDSSLRFKEFDLSVLAKHSLSEVEPLLKERSLTITKQLHKTLSVTSDEGKVRQIIGILLDNAIKYTDPKGKIEAITRTYERQAQVIIKNTHIPIPNERLARLFDRFYQADESHQDKGHGLGLAIAQSAARKINAELSVAQADGMVIFTLTLPLEQSHTPVV